MHRAVRSSILVALLGLIALVPAALAQTQGQVTELTITDPNPTNFNATTPFRTNKTIIRIKFRHNGQSGSYFINSDGADVDGSTFLPQPGDQTGEVLAGFLQEGLKTINLVLLQTRINVVATTNVPVVVAFDITPPTLILQSLRIGGTQQGGTDGTTFGLQAPAAGGGAGTTPNLTDPRFFTVAGANNPFRTRADNIVITAVATDNFSPLADIKATSSVPEAGIAEADVPPVQGQAGSFQATFNLSAAPEGLLSLTVKANDQVHNPITTTLEKGNVTAPHVVRIIRDITPPRITNIQIIRPLTGQADRCNKPATTLTTGANTFVGNELVGVKITFSEPITVPNVRITQQGGTATPLTPTTVVNGRASEITFGFSPIPTDNLNGAAKLEISGRNVGTNGAADPGVGIDEAGNGVTAADATFITVDPVFIVDTIPPDLSRDATPQQKPIVTPPDGAVLTAETFPEKITAQLVDKPFTGRPNSEASGIDFSQIVGLGPTNPTSGALNIQLVGPAGPIPLPPQVAPITGSPPSTLELTLGPADPGLATNANFRRDVNDGILRPIEGTYTITYNLIDKVCNTVRRTTTFRVDTTPIRESELFVTLGTTQIQRKGFCIPAAADGNPPTEFPLVTVRSTATDFSTTSSTFEVLACFNGNDSPCYPTVLTTFTRDPVRGTIASRVLGIQKVDPTGVDFPRPTTGVPQGDTGGNGIDPNTFDPRVGKFDGPYIIRLRPVDAPGNRGVITTDGRRNDFLDFDVNLDTIKPFTERTFPRDGQFINAPLRIVDATVVDPPAKRTPRTEVLGDFGNPTNVAKVGFVPGCGIDVRRTQVALRIENAYQPNRVPKQFIVGQPNNPINAGQIRGTLRFEHVPNGTDPTQPGFTLGDDRFKVLLEITMPSPNVVSLPGDGSMDGIYSIGVNPVDRSGLSLLQAGQTLGGTPPLRRGSYFGIQNTEATTISLTGFFFMFDNAAPRLDVNNFPDNTRIGSFEFHRDTLVVPSQQALVAAQAVAEHIASDAEVASSQHKLSSTDFAAGPTLGTRTFKITGATRDLSNKGSAFGSSGSNINGAAGIARVEYQLTLVDRNFQVITPPSPCPPSPVANPDGSVSRACLNPIISLRSAKIETFPQSIDPVPATTDPLIGGVNVGHDPYPDVVRPDHRFTIEDTLPDPALIPKPRPSPEQDFYLFTIRSVDRAGNQTELSRRVNLGSLNAPALLEPPDNCCRNTSVIQFKWAPVTGITTYVIEVTQPDGLPTITAAVRGTATSAGVQLSFGREGTYSWRVRSQDPVGGLSPASATRTFRIDRTPPRITNIIITDNVHPVTRNGVLSIGDVLFTVEFDEPLDRAPFLTFDPVGESVEPQQTTTDSFVGNVAVFRGKIPPTAKPSEWDGIATIQVHGVFDPCGNGLREQPSRTFEIDTGPDVDTRFFFNPVANQEIVVVLLSTEELKLPPRVTELINLQQISNQAYPFQRAPRAHYSAFTLASPRIASEVGFTVSSEDLEGNASRRPVSFTVTPLTSGTASSALSLDRRMSVHVPAGAVGGTTPLYLLPPTNPAKYQIARSVHRLFPTVPSSSKSQAVLAGMDAKPAAEQGLKVIAYLNELAPAGVALAKAARVTAVLPPGVAVPEGVTPQQLGMYVWTGSTWRWAGASVDGQMLSGSLSTLGPLAAAIDQAPPTISALSVKDGEKLDSPQPVITAQIGDSGAGVSRSGIQVLLDDKPVGFEFRDDTGELSFTPARPLASGQHSLALVVRDRAGNASQQQKLTVSAPAPFGLAECIAYPSPARTFTKIRLRLTQAASTARVAVDLYDVSGRRLRRLSADGPFASAVQDLEWDLTTDEGRGVANGVYLFRATVTGTAGQAVKSRGKLAVLR